MVLTAIAVLMAGFEKEEEQKYSGIIKFTSERGGQYFVNGYGFSFEKGKNIVCNDINCTEADVVAISLTDIHGPGNNQTVCIRIWKRS